ncbi:unnamed protein product [Didymodactylos carnosus]|uniref:Uncharacterized protein n=2 Tax=Didymodactylos carnosus TaxID=1234261 RepID=A0A8S2I709_9BILA|nr:unnamed protein product [Didymodactylos carnosus]CAF3717548.1 unnamed protein product [Didymodactylos carnosus]
MKIQDIKQYLAQMLAEFFATFLLILIGNGSVAQFKFTGPPGQSHLAVQLTWGVGVYTALMVAGPISGAHLNPAVSISLCTLQKLKVLQCSLYVIGQILGAFMGSLLVFVVYINLFSQYDGGIRQISGANGTADIFVTFPYNDELPNWNCLIDQIVATCFLMIFIMALGNDYNHLVSQPAKPFAFVLLVTALGSGLGLNCGNPVR